MPIYLVAAIIIILCAARGGHSLRSRPGGDGRASRLARPRRPTRRRSSSVRCCSSGDHLLHRRPHADDRAGRRARSRSARSPSSKRSWALTAGHWWRLFGFLVLFFIAAMIVLVGGRRGDRADRRPVARADRADVGWRAGRRIGPGGAQAALDGVLAVMLARIYVQLAGRARRRGRRAQSAGSEARSRAAGCRAGADRGNARSRACTGVKPARR